MKSIKSYTNIRESLYNGDHKIVGVLGTCLSNVEEHKDLNAFLRVYAKESMDQAIKLDSNSSLNFGKLHGMIVGLKDMFSYNDHPMQASSKILDGYIAKYSATSVQRLVDNGAIIVGHQNCDEFGMGSSNENSAFGPVHNLLDKNLVPGGSSGGSAVAVQAHMCHASLGTDTGGSVRQPAAFCGIVGLKPTYSRISRYGVVGYASSLDTVGILTRTIEDCAVVLETIAGVDDFDSTVSKRPVEKYSEDLNLSKKVKVAYIKEALEFDNLQPEIKQNTEDILNKLKEEGHCVNPIDFPLLHYALPTYYVLANAEASSNLACYDGVRYGYRAPDFENLQDMYKKTRTQGFGEEVKRRIIIGTCVLSEGSKSKWLTQAQKVRRLIRDAICAALSEYDFIILPTTPTTAFEIGKIHNPLDMYLADLFTVPASIAGVPAISVPNGVDKKGLPIGLQILAAPFQEKNLLAFAKHIEERRGLGT